MISAITMVTGALLFILGFMAGVTFIIYLIEEKYIE